MGGGHRAPRSVAFVVWPFGAVFRTLLTQNQQTFRVIVTVHVRPDNPRHFGFPSRQRPTRTRGVITRCRKMGFAGSRSGSGESWFEPRRGNFSGRTAFAGGRFRFPLVDCVSGC